MKCSLCGSNDVYNGFFLLVTKDLHYYGFLNNDIETLRKKYNQMVCCYCKATGANICCSKKNCSSWFHLICGIENGAINQFAKPYRSYCHRHIPKFNYRPNIEDVCYICFERLYNTNGTFSPAKMLRAPCCRNGWFHRLCLQKLALVDSIAFKCPLCNDVNNFKKHMPYWGVFVPSSAADFMPTYNANALSTLQQVRYNYSYNDWSGYEFDNSLDYSPESYTYNDCRRYNYSHNDWSGYEFDNSLNYSPESYTYNDCRSLDRPPVPYTYKEGSGSDSSYCIEWIVNNVLAYPFIILRRQFQLCAGTSLKWFFSKKCSYHLLPFSLLPIIVQLYKQHGLIPFWKGFGVCLVYRGISWVVHEIVFFLKDKSPQSISWLVYLLAKFVSAFFMLPLDIKCLVRTVHAATTDTYLRESIFDDDLFLYFLIIEIARDILSWLMRDLFKDRSIIRSCEYEKKQVRANLRTQFLTSMILYPFETILYRMQLQKTTGVVIHNLLHGNKSLEAFSRNRNYNNVSDCYRSIVRKEGLSGLYKGFGALILQFAVQYTVIKIAKRIFG